MNIHQHKHHSGFTMPEVILVSAVIAILVVMIAGNMMGFVDTQREKEEQAAMAEIERAAEGYIVDAKRLPASQSEMAVSFAAFGNMSSDQIERDTWDRPRVYVMAQVDVPYKYAALETFTGYVVGLGYDGCVADTATCYTELPDNQADVENAVALSYDVSDFANLEAIEDDVLIKFSDIHLKKDLYQTTVERLERVAKALERYSRTKYYEDLADDVTDVELKIYYPPSTGAVSGLYGNEVWTETGNAISARGGLATSIDSSTDDEDRLEGMLALMKLLNLPESYCCSAMAQVDVSGTLIEKPFFYYSHPTPRRINSPVTRATDCDEHPVALSAKLAARKLPARITVNQDVCG